MVKSASVAPSLVPVPQKTMEITPAQASAARALPNVTAKKINNYRDAPSENSLGAFLSSATK